MAIREALKDDPDATVVELPGLNHLFQAAPTGAPVEYARIEETMAPVALDMLADWVAAHAKTLNKPWLGTPGAAS